MGYRGKKRVRFGALAAMLVLSMSSYVWANQGKEVVVARESPRAKTLRNWARGRLVVATERETMQGQQVDLMSHAFREALQFADDFRLDRLLVRMMPGCAFRPSPKASALRWAPLSDAGVRHPGPLVLAREAPRLPWGGDGGQKLMLSLIGDNLEYPSSTHLGLVVGTANSATELRIGDVVEVHREPLGEVAEVFPTLFRQPQVIIDRLYDRLDALRIFVDERDGLHAITRTEEAHQLALAIGARLPRRSWSTRALVQRLLALRDEGETRQLALPFSSNESQRRASLTRHLQHADALMAEIAVHLQRLSASEDVVQGHIDNLENAVQDYLEALRRLKDVARSAFETPGGAHTIGYRYVLGAPLEEVANMLCTIASHAAAVGQGTDGAATLVALLGDASGVVGKATKLVNETLDGAAKTGVAAINLTTLSAGIAQRPMTSR